jgi:hypothetical protein
MMRDERKNGGAAAASVADGATDNRRRVEELKEKMAELEAEMALLTVES